MRLQRLSMMVALFLLVAFFGLSAPQFLGARNLSMLAIEVSITAGLALGMLLVILPGHIDLSVGSGAGLFGAIPAVLIFQYDVPAGLALALCLPCAVLVYGLMGSVIVRERIPAFIITLGGLLVFKGVHLLVIQNATVPVARGGLSNAYSLLTTYYFPPTVSWALAGAAWLVMVAFRLQRSGLGDSQQAKESTVLELLIVGQGLAVVVTVANAYRGLSLSLVLLGLCAAAIYVLLAHTRFGRHLLAIGGNEEAASLSGIRVQRNVIYAFCVLGAIVAVTGYLQTAYTGASTTTIGQLLELDAVAACVIGGTSLKGGRGDVLGVLFGAVLMATLLNGMALLAVSPELKLVARGSVLSGAVWLDLRLSRREAPRRIDGGNRPPATKQKVSPQRCAVTQTDGQQQLGSPG